MQNETEKPKIVFVDARTLSYDELHYYFSAGYPIVMPGLPESEPLKQELKRQGLPPNATYFVIEGYDDLE